MFLGGLCASLSAPCVPRPPERPTTAPWPSGTQWTRGHVPQALTEAPEGRKTRKPPGYPRGFRIYWWGLARLRGGRISVRAITGEVIGPLPSRGLNGRSPIGYMRIEARWLSDGYSPRLCRVQGCKRRPIPTMIIRIRRITRHLVPFHLVKLGPFGIGPLTVVDSPCKPIGSFP